MEWSRESFGILSKFDGIRLWRDSMNVFARFIQEGVGIEHPGRPAANGGWQQEDFLKAFYGDRFPRNKSDADKAWERWKASDGAKTYMHTTKNAFRKAFFGAESDAAYVCIANESKKCNDCVPCRNQNELELWFRTPANRASLSDRRRDHDPCNAGTLSAQTTAPRPLHLIPAEPVNRIGRFAAFSLVENPNGTVQIVFSFGEETVIFPAEPASDGKPALDELRVGVQPREMMVYIEPADATMDFNSVEMSEHFRFEKGRWIVATPKRPNIPLPIRQTLATLKATGRSPSAKVLITCRDDDFDAAPRNAPPDATQTDLRVLERMIALSKQWGLAQRGATELVLVTGEIRAQKKSRR